MGARQIDPARLDGEELRLWYERSPEQLRREREAAEERRQAAFYGQARAASGEAGTRYGSLYAPPPDDLAELRRQQAAFERERRAISKQNSWMAVPALAPAAAVAGLETAAAIAGRLAAPAVARGPLVLTERMPYLRVGHNWATRAGQRAHQFYKDMASAKPGWEPEPRVTDANGRLLKPDFRTPPRATNPNGPNYVEVKPNTPSGRAAAARQVRKYAEATGQAVRALFYDPKRFR